MWSFILNVVLLIFLCHCPRWCITVSADTLLFMLVHYCVYWCIILHISVYIGDHSGALLLILVHRCPARHTIISHVYIECFCASLCSQVHHYQSSTYSFCAPLSSHVNHYQSGTHYFCAPLSSHVHHYQSGTYWVFLCTTAQWGVPVSVMYCQVSFFCMSVQSVFSDIMFCQYLWLFWLIHCTVTDLKHLCCYALSFIGLVF